MKTKILLIRRGAIGDVIMATAAVSAVSIRYETKIDVCTDYPEVFLNSPYVDNVISYDEQYADKLLDSYQVIFDLDDAYEINPTKNYLNSFMERVGEFDTVGIPQLFHTDADIDKVNAVFADATTDYIVVHLRNWHWGAKNISMDAWFEIFTELFETNPTVRVCVVGSLSDHFIDHPSFTDLRGKLSLQEMKVLCMNASCFVGIDSAPFHVATTTGCHMVGLLTHLRPSVIMPSGYQYVAIQTQEDCAGCNDLQTVPVRQVVCHKGNFPCTNNFDAGKVARRVADTLYDI